MRCSFFAQNIRYFFGMLVLHHYFCHIQRTVNTRYFIFCCLPLRTFGGTFIFVPVPELNSCTSLSNRLSAMDFSTFTNFLSNNVLIILIAGFFIVKAVFQASGNLAIEEAEDSKVITVTSEAVWNEATEAAYKSDKIVLVDFYATWCGPCRTAAPIYSKMSTEFSDVTFLKVDVDKMRTIMQTHKVRAMPTFVLLKNGAQVDRVEGFREANIRAMIAKHRVTTSASAGAKKGE